MDGTKKNVWKHLFRLIIPHKKRFLLIVFIGLLSTGANPLFLQAMVYIWPSVGRTVEAEEMMRDAIRLNPYEVLAYINLGNLSDQLGRKDDAAKAYEKAVSFDPTNVRAHYNLGLLFFEQGKIIDADKEFTQTLALSPMDSDALVQQNLVRERMEK